ncbi:MAG TPA: type 1 glutamine amidotransferase, partial [Caulobacteraceae bacterium]|nr:type 1 glutamine amidotransferase [Caulobacteraceae bacterium]
FAGVLVLGGVMSANDDAIYPAFAPMRQLLREFHTEDKALLGICLGAQILARCFGREVRRHKALEIGYVPLAITEKGKQDPLLAGLPDKQWIMEYHEDTFDLPTEAVQLMKGEACANQAFRVGRATYGFQCHFEATPEVIETWIETSRQGLVKHLGDRVAETLDQLRKDLTTRADAQRKFAEAVSDRWLDLAERRQAPVPA